MSDVAPLIAAALAELKASYAAQKRAITRLEQALQQAVQQGLQDLPVSEALPSDHRRAHALDPGHVLCFDAPQRRLR